MSKTFLYRLFGIGKLPASVLTSLEKEGIVLLDEGIRATVTYRNFRAPGRYSNWKRQWFSSSIILTKTRLLALRLRSKIIDVPLTDERFRQLRVSLERIRCSSRSTLRCFKLIRREQSNTVSERLTPKLFWKSSAVKAPRRAKSA